MFVENNLVDLLIYFHFCLALAAVRQSNTSFKHSYRIMAKHHLRHNKDCLNCGRIVEERYCTHCGQENTETRQSFGHLVRHVVEDLTHYESGFWKTIKYLLFRPALLTKEYLAGKRMTYVAPVRLYLFVSFICFFLPAILPDFSKEEPDNKSLHHEQSAVHVRESETAASANKRFRDKVYWGEFQFDGTRISFFKPNDYTSVAQLDSMQTALPVSERYNWLEYKMAKRTIEIYDRYTDEQVSEKFRESFTHNIPKVFFVYMPFFAFFLLRIHRRKRKWMYFDHAIFTLHYFSFMLLIFTFFSILNCVFSPLNDLLWMDYLQGLYVLGGLIWIIYYFFRAHRKMYGESWIVSAFKSFVLFVLNLLFILFLAFVFTNVTLFGVH